MCDEANTFKVIVEHKQRVQGIPCIILSTFLYFYNNTVEKPHKTKLHFFKSNNYNFLYLQKIQISKFFPSFLRIFTLIVNPWMFTTKELVTNSITKKIIMLCHLKSLSKTQNTDFAEEELSRNILMHFKQWNHDNFGERYKKSQLKQAKWWSFWFMQHVNRECFLIFMHWKVFRTYLTSR